MPFKREHAIGLMLSCAGVIITVLSGVGLTVNSYGRLTEKVDGLDQRLARIERFIDSKATVVVKP